MLMKQVGRSLLFLWPLAILLPFVLAGCGDDSRTTGTQVQLSEEAKAQVDDMREMYKTNAKGKAAKK